MPKSRLTIVGCGLIGGSIGLALKKSKLDLEIVGHDKDRAAAGRAQKRGAVDSTKWNLIDACEGAGLIVLALPLDGIKETLAALKPYVSPGVIITDTATTKVPVMEWSKDLPENVYFVGGDPIVKADRLGKGTGIDAADADLFQGATYCLVSTPNTPPPAVDAISYLATLLGAKPYFIDAAEHDGLTTAVQHLPALLATALQSAIMGSRSWVEISRLAGSDFRAATELAPASPKTAREQFMAHRIDLIRWIDGLNGELTDLRGMLEREDTETLEKLVQAVQADRARWLSGALEETESAANWDAVQMNPARLFMGALADRPKKR